MVSTSENKKVALVGWTSVFQPKKFRGLVLLHLEDQNASFLLKLGFQSVKMRLYGLGFYAQNME